MLYASEPLERARPDAEHLSSPFEDGKALILADA
jgi:hypothetical protein